MARTAGQTVQAHLAASCLPCITLGYSPTSRHTQFLEQTAFSTTAIQCGVVFMKLPRSSLFSAASQDQVSPREPGCRCVQQTVEKSGVDFPFNQDDVPCTSTAHEFVSVQLAVPRARLASRQSPVACTMNGCRCIAFVGQTSRCTLDSQAVFYVALRSTNTHISSAKGCVSRFLISHRAEFW
jgi:hypothetical protein